MTNNWKASVAQIVGPKLSGATATALTWAGAQKQPSKVIKRSYYTGSLDRMPIPHKINPENRKKIARKPKKGNAKRSHDQSKDDSNGGRLGSRHLSAYGGSHSTADTDEDAYFDTDLEEEDRTYEHSLRDKNAYFYACKKFNVVPSSYFMKNMGKSNVLMNYQGIGDKGCAAMCVPLMNNHTITTLELAGNAITAEGAEFLLEMFRENIFINDLSLAENPLGSEGAKIVSEILKINNQITKLDISGCGLTEKDAIHIADILNNTTTLEHLIITNNEFGDKGGEILGPAIGANDSLLTLDLSWNHLRLKGAIAVADGLKMNNTLKTLNVSWNGFSKEGAKVLGEALAINNTLQELDASCNRLTVEAIDALMKETVQNQTLRRLKLNRNPMGVKGAFNLLEKLKTWSEMPLRRLELYNVQMDAKEIATCLNEIQELYPSLVIRQGSLTHKDDKKTKVRLGRQEDPMEVLMNFVKEKEINTIDLFKQFDTDNSWSVSRDEFRLGIKIAKIPLSDDQLITLMDKLDADGDGEIDFGELIKGQKDFEDKVAKRQQRSPSIVPQSLLLGQ